MSSSTLVLNILRDVGVLAGSGTLLGVWLICREDDEAFATAVRRDHEVECPRLVSNPVDPPTVAAPTRDHRMAS
jgi:hypothetical protein